MGLNKNIKIAFEAGFENRCIQLIVAAYNQTITAKSVDVNWDENDVTAQLHEYIDSNPLRLNWFISSNVEHHLPKDTFKKEKGFAAKYPRIDLRFTTFKSKTECKYFFEAKNLKEKDSKLKRRYIETGIDNYISGKYQDGCLVGYLLEGDLGLTVTGINSLLKKDNRNTETLNKKKFKFHDSYYESTHSAIGVLKHLIFDFT